MGRLNGFLVKCLQLGLCLTQAQDIFMFYSMTKKYTSNTAL